MNTRLLTGQAPQVQRVASEPFLRLLTGQAPQVQRSVYSQSQETTNIREPGYTNLVDSVDSFVEEQLDSRPVNSAQTSDFVPTTPMIAATINEHSSGRALLALMDSGASNCLIHRRALPPGAVPTLLPRPLSNNTAAGDFAIKSWVQLSGVNLPEFGRYRINNMQCLVFDAANCEYDLIIGRDWLIPFKFNISFEELSMTFRGETIPMKPKTDKGMLYADAALLMQENFATEILRRKYEAHDLDEVVSEQQHLNAEQRKQLRSVFEGHDRLFDGKLKKYERRQMHLQLKPGAQPIHCKAYSTPRVHENTFRDEIQKLVDDDVLEPVGATEHAYPTFIIPKKDGRVRVVSDFRKLNAMLVRRTYPLPRIQDILSRRKGYSFFTKIDISMQYYTFELDDESKDLCVIVTPFGKYRYKRVPMGVHQSPDFAQQEMEELLRDLREVDVYMDDIGVFTDTFAEHCRVLRIVLTKLQDHNFTVNPLKCEWAVKETDWLGYWLTPTGLKPWDKKVKAIRQLSPPTNMTQLRSFIGAVNYYRDMWPRRSHILAPLTEQTGAKRFLWTPPMQAAFDTMKQLLAADVHLAYPDPNKPYNIETDASDLQLGAVIKQDGRPVAYFSRKLSAAQRNYTTMEKELLSIVEVLKEFRSMLLGTVIHVHTDHKNLTYANLNTQRVLRWRLFIEEFRCHFHYLPGASNVLADFLSRCPLQEEKSADPTDGFDLFFSTIPLEVYLNAPVNTPNPTNYQLIAQLQQASPGLVALHQHDPLRYPMHPFGNRQLICYQPPHSPNFTIYIPDELLPALIRWYHYVTGHAGQTRLLQTIASRWYHPQLRVAVNNLVRSCEVCQRYKQSGPGYGLLPPREAVVQPFYEVAVDLVGPWTIRVNNERIAFTALTAIDPCTTLTEAVVLSNKTSSNVATQFEQMWLHRYPRPVYCIHDAGTEFTGYEFQQMMRRWALTPHPISVKNPQANAVCERMHQTVGNILRTTLVAQPPQTIDAARAAIIYAVSTAVHAMRTTVHSTLQQSPGAIVFHRDMLLDVPFIADLMVLRDKRQALIDYNLRKENNKRRSYDYQPGQYAWKKVFKPDRMEERLVGPFRILHVHTNGTITLRIDNNITERINIRRCEPYLAAME